MKQVWSIIQMADMPLSAFRRVFLFHLFRLFHTFHGTEHDAGIKADFCSIGSTCPTHSVERNGTRPMVLADRYGRSAPVTGESGQSQFAPLKLRSLALVPSSGAQCAPTNSTYGSSTVRLFLPRRSAPVRDSRPFRTPASPVPVRGVSDGRNVLQVPGAVPLSGQPAAGLSPPGRCAPSHPIKGKRLRDSCRPHAAAACRCPCHRTPEAGKRLAL